MTDLEKSLLAAKWQAIPFLRSVKLGEPVPDDAPCLIVAKDVGGYPYIHLFEVPRWLARDIIEKHNK